MPTEAEGIDHGVQCLAGEPGLAEEQFLQMARHGDQRIFDIDPKTPRIGRIPRLPVKIKHLNYPNRDTDKQVKRAEPILGFTIRRIGNEKRLAKFAQ